MNGAAANVATFSKLFEGVDTVKVSPEEFRKRFMAARGSEKGKEPAERPGSTCRSQPYTPIPTPTMPGQWTGAEASAVTPSLQQKVARSVLYFDPDATRDVDSAYFSATASAQWPKTAATSSGRAPRGAESAYFPTSPSATSGPQRSAQFDNIRWTPYPVKGKARNAASQKYGLRNVQAPVSYHEDEEDDDYDEVVEDDNEALLPGDPRNASSQKYGLRNVRAPVSYREVEDEDDDEVVEQDNEVLLPGGPRLLYQEDHEGLFMTPYARPAAENEAMTAPPKPQYNPSTGRFDKPPATTHVQRKRGPRYLSGSCSNCQATTTLQWRSDGKGNRLCNACGTYWQKNGRARPVSLAVYGSARWPPKTPVKKPSSPKTPVIKPSPPKTPMKKSTPSKAKGSTDIKTSYATKKANQNVPTMQLPSPSARRVKGLPWTDEENEACLQEMDQLIRINMAKEPRDREGPDWTLEKCSEILETKYNIDRKPGAIRNQWNRFLRIENVRRGGMDERRNPNPDTIQNSLSTLR